MPAPKPPIVAAAVCLAGLAGFVDALAFATLGGFFASFMSGNATRIGVGLGGGAGGDAMLALALALAFVSGAIVASVIARATPLWQRPAVAVTVAALLAGAAAADRYATGAIVGLPLAAAMGAAHLIVRREAEALGGASLTGALVLIGERLAGALSGDGERWGWVTPLLLWTGFVGGAVLGAAAQFQLGSGAFWLAALGAALCAVWLHAEATRRPRLVR